MPAQNKTNTAANFRIIRNAGVTLSTTLNLLTLRGGPTDGCGNRISKPCRAIVCNVKAGNGTLRLKKAGSFATTASATEILTLADGVEYAIQVAKILPGGNNSQFSEITILW